MAVNARQYIKNVGKSFGYLAADYFGSNNPAVKSLIDSTKEATNELKSAIDDIKDKAKEGSNEKNLLAEPIQVGKDFIGNFISDIKSGKWYNKERSNEYEEKLAKGFIGDMDFDFDDDFDTDFDMDFDVDDDDDSDIDMAKTVDTVGSKVSEAVSMATAKSAQYIVSSSSRNTRAMMEQNNRLFFQVNTGISSINNNLMALVRLGTDVNTHIQNSGVFYTKSTELQTKQVELLEKLVKNTSPVENKVETRKSSATRISNLLGSDDILDFVEYFKAIKDNIKNEVSFLSDMNNMFKNEDGGGESILGQIAASPVKMVLSTVVEGLIPQVLKDSMENFNETLSGFFGGLLQKLNNASSDNFILDKILDILHIDNRLKKSLDPSLYKKDKVDFDGITRKSIVEVIPTYLSKILASLNGKDEMRYDYEQGVFRSVTEIKKAKDDIVKNKAKSIGYDIKELFEEYVSDLPDKEELLRNLDNYFVKAIEKNDKIEYRQTSRHTKDYFKEFGLDERTGKLLVETLTKAAKDGKTAPAANFSKETMLARESITDEFKRIEEKGGSILNYLFDNSIDKDNIGTLTSSPLNLNNIYDQYHNNIFYYLQGIWQFTGHISDNIQNIGGGGGPSSPKGPRGPKGKGGTSRVFEKMRDIQDNTPKKEAPKAKQFTKYEYEEYIRDIKGYYTDKGWQSELKFDSFRRRHFGKDKDKKDEKLKDIIKDKDIKTYEEFTEMSQEERDKYLSKLADSKKKIKDSKKNEDKEEKEPKTWFGRMVQSIKKVATAPGKAAADILNWGSNKMLDVLYGKDRDPDKGFMDILAEETKDIFNKFKKWIDDNILKKFDLGTVDDYIDKLFGKKGEDGKRHGGWFGKVGNNIAEDFKSAGRWVKNIFTDGFGAVKDFFTGDSKTNAATGGNVTKTGLVAVSEGELIIPSELNPYYKGKTDKSKQRRDESNIVKRFYGKFEAGGVGGDKKGTEEFKKDKEEANKENTTKAEKIKGFFSKAWNKFTGTEEDPGLGRDMFNTTKDGASKVYDQLFGKRKKKKGKDNDKTDEKKTEDKVKKTIGTVLKELGVPDKFSSVITGNIIGGGISLLTGGIISPMLGAAIGGAVGLTLKSKKVQTALFGGKDENGDDVEGLLPKKVADFIQKYIPSMAKLGVVGGASGLLGLIPGGPVAGIVVGSALGYAIKTEKFKDWLFGNEDKGIDGVINKELREKIKKAVPNIATGALVGLTVGPFGIVGNLLVGSALGYATTTEKFKEKMFGKDGEGGGILTMIREKVLDPLQETIQAVAHEISFQMKKMFKSTTSMLKKAFEDMILLPIQKAVKDLLLKPFGKIAKGLLAIPTFLVGGAFKAVTGLGGLLKRKQIRKGQASYMTAQERLDYREEKGMGNEDRTFKFDEMVSNMSEDEVKQFRESVKGVQDPTKDLRKKSQKALNNITGALSADDKLTTREIYKITKKIKDGKTDKAMADIDEYGKKRGMSNKEIESLKEKVLNNANEYNSLKEKKKDISSYTKEKLKEIEKKYGIKINQKNAWQYEDLLKGELKGRAKYEEAKSPEQKMMDQNEKHHNEIIENMKEIINGINNIANGVPPTSNKKEEEFLPPAVVEDIKEKTNSTNPFDDKTDNESDNDDEYSGNIFERIKQVTSRKNGFTLTDLINAIKGKKKEKKEHINVDPLNDIIDASSLADNTVKEAFDKVRNDAEDAEFKEVAEEKSGNILDKIAGFFNGKNIKVSANKDSGIYKFFEKFGKSKKDKEEENVRYTSTATGELLKNVKNGQGEWELDRTDKETNDIIEQQRAVQDAQISTSKHLGGLGGTLGDLFSKLFHKDEDKPTLLDKIKEKLFDGFDFIKDKLGGTVNNILNFFTGGNLSSLISTAAGTIVTAIGAGLVIKAFLGSKKIENFVEAIVNGITGQDEDEPDSAEGNTTFSDKRTSSIDINGKTTKILVDKNGNPEKDGDGNYVDAKGNIIDGSSGQWVTEEKSGRTLQSRLFENTARSVVGGKFVKDATGKIVGFTPKAGVATTVAKKVAGDKGVQAIGKGVSKAAKVTKNIATKAGKKIASSKAGQAVKKGAAKVVDKIAGKGVAEAAANQGLYKGFMKMISNALEKIPTILSKIPFLKRFADKADDIVTLLYTKLDDAAIKLASSSGKMLGNLASTMSTALVVLKVVFIVADFYTGYQDARTTLGIVDKPTEGQRLISGLIRVIKNLIPVISALIPDKALVSLFVNKIAPLLGIDVSDLKEQRKEAKEKVDAYNKKHGTDYNIEDYNKKVLKDYTITEKAGNFVRSVKKNIKEKGVVGAIKSGTQEYVEDKVDTFKKNFEKGGPVQAIAETVGSILPGYIGDGAKGTVYMAEMALKGKVKEVFSYTPTEDKNANMLTKILGQVSVLVPKLALTPVALISAGIRKVLGFLNLDNLDSLKEIGKDIGSVFKNAFTGNIMDMYKVNGGAKGDNTFASIFKNIALAIPKVALTPVSLITTGIRKLLEVLGIDSLGDVLDMGKDVIDMGKYAFTGQIRKLSSVGSDNGDNEKGGIAKWFKKFATFIPKMGFMPVALITTGIRKLLELLGIESFGDVLDIGKDIGSIFKNAFTGKLGDMYATDRSDKNDNAFLKFTKNLALAPPKLVMTPIALITTGIRKLLELLGLDSLDSVFDLGKDFGSVFKNAVTGKIGAMYKVGNRNAESDGAFANVFKNAALSVPKVIMTPVALITTGIRKVLELLNLDSFADILDLGGDLLDIGKYAITGRIGDMYKVGSSNKEDSDIARVIKNAALSIPKTILTPVAAVTSGVRFVGEKIAEGIGFIKKAVDMDGIKDKLSKVKSLEDLWKIKNTVDEKNNFKILNTVAVGLVKIVYTPMMIVKKIVNLFPNLIDKIKEKIGSVWDTVEDFIDDPIATITGKNKKKEKKDKGGNSGLYVGGGSGFISQNDPQYANTKYGATNVSQEGCGPAVAAMAVNNAYSGGNVISMKDTLAYAKRKGYEQKDGTTSDYFGDVFNQYGLGSEYINNNGGSKSKTIKDRLASGSSVVLLGRDANNTSKANSPFGPNNHYVLATGLDKKGNVIINDPEMNQPTVYDSKILDSSNLAISTGSGSRIRSRINKINRFKVYSGGASSVERQIFNFLTDKMGLNSAAASGILANIYKESSFNPNTVGDNGTSYGICQWHNGRYTNLKNWCAKNGLDYKSLHGQLCYLNHELTTGYKSMLKMFKSVPDTAEGAYKVGYEWCYKYERPYDKQAKSVERGKLARDTYFPKYKGQKGKYDKDMVISGKADTSVSNTSSSSDTGSSNETAFSKLTSLFGGLMGSYYGNNNPIANLLGFSSGSDNSDSNLTTYEGTLDGGPGNSKQKALVDKMKSKLGQLTYSMNGVRDPDKGSADCSSTVNWAYKKVFGKDIGNNTASILSNDNTQVVYVDNTAKQVTGTSSSKGPIESKLQPGDILLYSRPNSNYTAGRKYRVGHVEMYAGNGKRIGHGGGPDGKQLGPILTDLSRDGKHFIMAKRLKDIGKGSGIYDSRNYINGVHDSGSIVSIGGASKVDNNKVLKVKASTAAKKLSSKSASDETMIALIKSIVTLLTTMANNTTKINTIVELLQNYFNAKNGNTTTNTKQKSSAKTTKAPSLSTELDTATKELVDYLNSLAV